MQFLKPSFLIVGMQKAGTSALAKILDEHPDLALSRYKEVHFFNKFDQISEITPLEQLKYASHWHLRDLFSRRMRFEASPAYAHYNEKGSAPLRLIREFKPDMKVICSFRDPVKRAYSHWNMNRQRGKIDLGFEEVIRQEREDEAAGRPLRFTYLAQGRYDEIIDALFDAFPREQVHLITQEALKHEHDRVLHEVQTFLGVSPRSLPALIRHQRNYTYEPMTPEMAADLQAYFAPSTARFAEMTGLDVSTWSTAPKKTEGHDFA